MEMRILQQRTIAERLKDMPHIAPAYADSPSYHLNYDFEQAIVKIQRNQEHDLTLRERAAAKLFLRDS